MRKLLIILTLLLCSCVSTDNIYHVVCINIKNETIILDEYGYSRGSGYIKIDENVSGVAFSLPQGKNIKCTIERIDE